MFSERIRLLRKSYNYNQQELAGRLGVSKQSVSNWENGNILPSIDMLIKLAKLFSVSTDYILGLDNRLTIDITGLTVEKVSHIQQIINDMVRG
ncbi:MAG: helix-turn-helix transcriptional regulator [Provencibacterium sp.]|jgi:transcriptional regulator with XRE-family HTH domain|nr:helix-turn-helix transcriptional regulator [Provencibacterium sp.]